MKIYKLTNTVNNKSFIGVTKRSLKDSFNAHVAASKNADTSLLAKALLKYGRKSFTIELLETVTDEDPERVKSFWIDRLGTLYPNGYNQFSKNHGTTVFSRTVSDIEL